MSAFTSLKHFPDEWGKRARCPVCQHASMQIMRFDSAPDQMRCQYCGVSFEIEENGQHLFFVDTPLNLENELRRRWVTRNQLSSVIENKKIETASQNSALEAKPAPSRANPLRADAVKKARTLVELGNSAEVIRQSLTDTMNVTDFAIEEIISDAIGVHKMKMKKRFQKITVISAVALTLVITLLFFLTRLF